MRTRLSLRLATGLVAAIAACSTSAASDLPLPAKDLPAGGLRQANAVFALGCFWCGEAVFEQIAGVTDVVSGYAGGTQADADYHRVGAGETRHAESIRVTYDPTKVSYGQLLRVFFTLHDPTTLDRQGPDWGHQYRSAIFYTSDEQKRVAKAYIDQLGAAKAFGSPIVTTLEPIGLGFFLAEAYHQDYVRLHPDDPYVRAHAIAKIKKVREKFAGMVKPR